MSALPVVLGLDYGGTKIATAVCDTSGERLGSATVDSGASLGARACFDRGIDTAHRLLAQAAPDRELIAVGVSTFGIPYDDHVELSPTVPGWDTLAFGAELRSAFPGARVAMATDVKAAAAAEYRWGALAGCDPGVYLNLGTGLAVAIVAGGKVMTGAHGASGEIGYNLRAITDVGMDQRTILEETVSGQALGLRATAAWGPRMTAADVFAADGATAERILDEFLTELAYHLVNLTILIDPARIAVAGGMVRSFDRLAPALERALAAGVPYPPELVTAEFPFDAPLMGALALATETVHDLLGKEASV